MKTKVFIEESIARRATNILPHILALMWLLIVPMLLLSSCRTSQKITKEEMAVSTSSEQTSSAASVFAFSSLDSLFRMMSLQIDSIVLEFLPSGETDALTPGPVGIDTLVDSESAGLFYPGTSATYLTQCRDSIQSGGIRLPRDGLQKPVPNNKQANSTNLSKVKISGVRLNSEESLIKNVDTSVRDSFNQTANDNTQSFRKEESSVTRESFPFVKAIGWLTIAFIFMIALVLIYRKRRWVIGVFTKFISLFK